MPVARDLSSRAPLRPRARALGRGFVVHFFGRRLKKVERAIARRGFWSLVGVRFMPLPFALVNYGAALAGVPAGLFLLSSAIGLAPVTLFFSYFAATLAAAAGPQRAAVIVQLVSTSLALLALSLAPPTPGPPSAAASATATSASSAASASAGSLATSPKHWTELRL